MAEAVTPLTDEQFQALRATYPEPQHELVRVQTRAGELVIRNPAEPEHHAFTTETWGKQGTEGYPAAYRNALVMQCVYPDKATLLAALARFPGLPTSAPVMRAIKYLSGEAETLAGKG